MIKKFKKILLLLGLIIFGLFGNVGCSNEKHLFDLNNEKYKYLFEDDFGENSITIINNIDEMLQQNLFSISDSTKYNDAYFSSNYLLIFRFNTHYSESDLKVEDSKIIQDNILLINISIDSPADYENNSFDAQISSELLLVDIPRNSITDINDLSVGILVINNRFNNVYCSVYYNCNRREDE